MRAYLFFIQGIDVIMTRGMQRLSHEILIIIFSKKYGLIATNQDPVVGTAVRLL